MLLAKRCSLNSKFYASPIGLTIKHYINSAYYMSAHQFINRKSHKITSKIKLCSRQRKYEFQQVRSSRTHLRRVKFVQMANMIAIHATRTQAYFPSCPGLHLALVTPAYLVESLSDNFR